MPVVLSQIFEGRNYKDAEGSLYHYPRQYFSRIRPYDSFVYYRPHGKRAPRPDALHYFGYGILGEPFEDVDDPTHRFVPLLKYEVFPVLVPLKDPRGRYYETESERPIQGQSAVRDLGMTPFHRILAAASVASLGISLIPSTEEIAAAGYFGEPVPPPKDIVRKIDQIPPGAGYVPQADRQLNVYESAALQERARADHQTVLRRIGAIAHNKGGWFWYNLHIDLVVELNGERTLIEAKSLNDLRDAVNRMRYGIGQLADYQVRYRAELVGAQSVLAFGRAPDRETSFIATVLEETKVAFIAQDDSGVFPMNETARRLQLF